MTPFHRTPSEELYEHLNKLVKEVLRDDYHTLSIEHLSLKEDILKESSCISCVLKIGETKYTIEGGGRGIVDALFSSLIETLETKFVSLRNLTLMDFSVEAVFGKKHVKRSNTDAEVEVRILIRSSDNDFIFRESSPSMNTAAIKTVLKVVEHFTNSERAVEIIYNCIRDARKRCRGDLVGQYLKTLTELVRSINYEKKIKTILEENMECEISHKDS